MPKNKYENIMRYTVYDNKTDFPIIVCGTAQECAKAMDIDINHFYYLTDKSKKQHGDRWFIIKEGKEPWKKKSQEARR